jgi:hypothetical protein
MWLDLKIILRMLHNDPTAYLKPQPNARFRFRLQHHDDPSLRHVIFIFECWDAKWKKRPVDIDPNVERDHHEFA